MVFIARDNVICHTVSCTVFQNVYNTIPIDTIKNCPLDDFIDSLRDCHQQAVADKTSNAMLCPAVFLPDTGRALKNIVEVGGGLWLDNDTGHFSPEQFAELFPGLQFIAFNTFSTTIDRPKYRLVIATDASMDADCYSAAMHEFIRRIAEIDSEHGFDLAPTHAAALFYLPCQAASGYSFFIVQPGAILEIENRLIRSPVRANDTGNLEETRFSVGEPPAGLIQALQKIPADDYWNWFRVCCALYNAFGEGGFTLADWWSQRSVKYNSHDVRKKWEDIARSGRGRRITIRTSYYLAKQYD
jgi:hypothetical protein